VERRPTAVPEAYSAYLRASALEESNKAQNEAGMDLLREAIRKDSSFAVAWATRFPAGSCITPSSFP
jgi:hypothetical protein